MFGSWLGLLLLVLARTLDLLDFLAPDLLKMENLDFFRAIALFLSDPPNKCAERGGTSPKIRLLKLIDPSSLTLGIALPLILKDKKREGERIPF